jgi:hypothetical protein
MPVRFHFARPIAFALVAVFAVATLAWASKPAPVVEPILPVPMQSVTVGHPLSPSSACVLGVNGVPAFAVNYLLPPDDAYYTLLRPSACGSCTGPGGVVITTALLALNFQVGCDQPITLSVVGASGDAPCRTPDPTTILCAATAYLLSPGAPGNYIFALALPAACCISQDAFLCVNFVQPGNGCSTASTRPRLITTASCAPCVSYNIYPGGDDDLCSPAVAFPGNPLIAANADCCSITPARSGSWGRLKLLYR